MVEHSSRQTNKKHILQNSTRMSQESGLAFDRRNRVGQTYYLELT